MHKEFGKVLQAETSWKAMGVGVGVEAGVAVRIQVLECPSKTNSRISTWTLRKFTRTRHYGKFQIPSSGKS
jgi:hypothetical protein